MVGSWAIPDLSASHADSQSSIDLQRQALACERIHDAEHSQGAPRSLVDRARSPSTIPHSALCFGTREK